MLKIAQKVLIGTVATSTILLNLQLSSQARPIREGNRYWEFSGQEVSSVMNQYGLSRFWNELDRRCNEGHRTQNKPWWARGRFQPSGNRHFCTF
ncbi:MAG: hypothetical protein AN482_13395 [Anabaena sp. LE011-02]|jgi:hypothetical protein|nr:MAG: hypothetical protein AN482_13395 [Anabaena sp. LE011-02]